VLKQSSKLVVIGLASVAVLATAAILSAAPQAKNPPKTAEMFPHMDAAIGYLKVAQSELAHAEPVFKGHRVRAATHVDKAIADLQKGIDDYVKTHPGTARNTAMPEARPPEGASFPHMEGALKACQDAEAQLSEAAHQYSGGRVEGLDETRAAITEIKAGLALAHK
jgi:hypothetical protein